MTLAVTLQDGRTESVEVPDGMTNEKALEAFVLGHKPFSHEWVKLVSGGYVRHGFIVVVQPS